MSASDWLKEAHEVKKQAMKSGSIDTFIQPIFKGKAFCLEYRDLKLRLAGMDDETKAMLKRSGVPRFLHNETYANWGGTKPKTLFVHGVLLRSANNNDVRRFVATHVCDADGKGTHNQISTLNLLFIRGFYTPIAQCSWMRTDEINPITLKRRLAAKEKLKIESRDGKRFTPKTPPIGLKLFDCMAWNSKPKKPKSKRKKK